MLLSLRNDHKVHLDLLTDQPPQGILALNNNLAWFKLVFSVVVDFCKLAIDFLQHGTNFELYTTAAAKLNVAFETVQNCVYGIVNLLLLSCKHELSEADFRDSILTLGFGPDQQTILCKFYKSKQKDVTEVLRKLAVDRLSYHDLDWRFQVSVASRGLLHQTTPSVTLNLSLKRMEINEEKGTDIRKVLMQTDPMNLQYVAEELERALLESKSRHSRRLQSSFTN